MVTNGGSCFKQFEYCSIVFVVVFVRFWDAQPVKWTQLASAVKLTVNAISHTRGADGPVLSSPPPFSATVLLAHPFRLCISYQQQLTAVPLLNALWQCSFTDLNLIWAFSVNMENISHLWSKVVTINQLGTLAEYHYYPENSITALQISYLLCKI